MISDGEVYNNQIEGHYYGSYSPIHLMGDYNNPGNVNVYGNTLLNNRTANSAVIIQDCISSIYDNINRYLNYPRQEDGQQSYAF